MGVQRKMFMARWGTADFLNMRALLLLVMALGFVALAPAQERRARVLLEDGRELIGRVVVMNLEQLQLVVDKEIVTIPAADIKSCRFEKAAEAPSPGETPPPAAPLGEGQAVSEPAGEEPVAGAASGSAEDQVVGAAADPGLDQPAPPPGASSVGGAPSRKRPGRNAGAVLSYEPATRQPPRSRFRARLEVIDTSYPWLCPTDPAQWISLGLLLFSALSLIIHMSVVVAGAESPHFIRSVGMACAGMVVGFAQFALVPGNDFAVFAMLIGNSALMMFTTRKAFGLARGSSFVAFVVQLGLAAGVFGILELVTTLLGSVGAT